MCYGATVFEGKANNTLEFPYQIHWKCAEFDPPIYLFITLKVASSVYTVMLYVCRKGITQQHFSQITMLPSQEK